MRTPGPSETVGYFSPKTRLVLAEQAGLGPLIPVMTKLIVVMAAAAQSGDRRLRLTVRGAGKDDEHQVGSGGSRPLGEVLRDPTERGSAGGGFDADEASVGHVNMLSAGCKHTSLDEELTRLLSPLFGKCSSLPPVVSSPLSGSLNPRSRVVWPGNRYVSSLSLMSSLVLFFPPLN